MKRPKRGHQELNPSSSPQYSGEAPPKLASFYFLAVVMAATALAFAPSLRCGFVNWDDDVNLLQNLNYRGLNWTHIHWMFTTFYLGPYQPLSWLSYGLDYKLWGMNPFGYHLTNFLLHIINAGLFYLVCILLIERIASYSQRSAPESLPRGAPSGPRANSLAEKARRDLNLQVSAAVAALVFAIHPLRAESVVWVTERRDVLSGLFYLLALLFYLKRALITPEIYGHNAPLVPVPSSGARRRTFGVLSLLCFACALISKAITVSLPIVLIILDLYPLRRLPCDIKKWAARESIGIWLEKIPYFALSLAAGLIGYKAQAAVGAMRVMSEYGTAARISQAFYGLAFYFWKTLWPFGLIPFYQTPAPSMIKPWVWPFWPALLAVLAISSAVVALRRRWPAGLALWAFYAVSLLPVLGIVKFGQYLVADRYSYLSCMGWAVTAGAFLHLALTRSKRRKSYLVGAALLCAGLGYLTWRQAGYWFDSESLWKHAVAVAPLNDFGHNNLGTALQKKGKTDEAIQSFRAALIANPTSMFAHYNLANSLVKQNKIEKAIEHYQAALALDPGYVPALNNFAIVLADKGNIAEALRYFKLSLSRDPQDAETHFLMANALSKQGNMKEAISHYREALRLRSDFMEAYNSLGIILAREGKFSEASKIFSAALRINPNDPYARANLSIVDNDLGAQSSDKGKFDEAIKHYRRALNLNPDNANAHFNLGNALAGKGKLEAAATEYAAALRLKPNFAPAQKNLKILSQRLGKVLKP